MSIWDQYKRTECFPNKCNCEIMQDSWLVQPVSTITNLPLLILSIYLMLQKYSSFKIKFLTVIFFIASLSSIFLHMSFTRMGQVLDFSCIGFVMAWIFSYYYIKRDQYFIFWIFTISFTILSISFFENLRTVIVLIFASTALFAILKNESIYVFIKNKHILRSILFSIIGIIFFYIDNKKIWCPENAWVQGHSIWHLIGTFICFYLFKFFQHKSIQNNQ